MPKTKKGSRKALPCSDLPAGSLCSETSSSLKEKHIMDMVKGSPTKVNEEQYSMSQDDEVEKLNDKFDVLDDHDEENRDSLYDYKMDDGEPIDMEVVRKYLKQVKESEGFVISDWPGFIVGLTDVAPLQYILDEREFYRHDYDRVMEMATLAINTYNEKHGTNYEVEEIEGLNSQGINAETYYITLSAVDLKLGDDELLGPNVARRIFRGKVVDDELCNKSEVLFCKPAPPPK